MIATPSQATKISTEDAPWTLIQGQSKTVRKVLTKRLLAEQEQSKTEKQQAMVKESLTCAFNEIYSGKVHHDARDLFKE